MVKGEQILVQYHQLLGTFARRQNLDLEKKGRDKKDRTVCELEKRQIRPA